MSKLTLITDSALTPPSRLEAPEGWSGHIPFAMWLVEQLKPNLIVELGTHTGNSYFALCQSVQANGLNSHCYAVDTWLGDEHAGKYDGEEVYSQVLSFNQERYAGFSKLLRMTFDEALEYFNDGTIDLLHIDGLHTYEAVHHDFDTWQSKLSEQSVVMFHDINVRQDDFGVWRLWEELSAQYPSLSFDHSYGLGVLFTGEKQPQIVLDLLEEYSSEQGRRKICNYFERLGFGLSTLLESRKSTNHFKKTIDHLKKTIDHLNDKTSHLDQKVQGLDAQNKNYTHQIEALNGKIGQLNDTLGGVLTSRSWALTRPLRFVGQILRRLTCHK